MVKLLMFDFDGTLVDTGPDIVLAMNDFLQSKGRPALPEKTVLQFVGPGLAGLMDSIYPEAAKDPKLLQQAEEEFLKFYERNYLLNNPRPLRDAKEFLRSCPYKMAVVSNKRVRFIPKVLDHLGLMDLPWVSLIGGDSFEHKKPHPKPLLEAIDAAGVTPGQAVMVGDGFPDVEAAKACEVTSVAVNFGYTPVEELLAKGAKYQISNFADLLQIFPK